MTIYNLKIINININLLYEYWVSNCIVLLYKKLNNKYIYFKRIVYYLNIKYTDKCKYELYYIIHIMLFKMLLDVINKNIFTE